MWILLYIAMLLACGYSVVAFLLDTQKPQRLAMVVGMSAALGCGLMPLILVFVSMIGFQPTRPLVLGIGATAFALIAILRFTNRLPPIARPVIPHITRGQIAIMALASLLIGVQSLSVLVAASAVPVIEVDAWNIWGLKAKVLYFEPLSPRPEYFNDLSLSYTHLDYPLLVPMLWTGAYGAMNQVDDAAGKAGLILPLAGIILLLYGALRDVVDRARTILLVGLAIGSPAIARWAGQGLADTPLAAFLLGAGVFIVRWMGRKTMRDAFGAGLFAALAIWTKLEGSILIISLLLIITVAISLDRSRLKSGVAMLLTAGLLALPWWIWSHGLPHTHENYLSRLSLASIFKGVSQLPELLGLFWKEFSDWRWTVPAAILLLAAALNARAFAHPAVLALWTIVVVQIISYVIAYLITPWKLDELVPITATRLVMHLAPLAMLLAGLHWREAKASI